MKKLSILILFICLLLASKMSGQVQDSARLRVTKVRTDDNKTHYWLKDMDTKENIYTVCSCVQKHKKGEIVMVARKDMKFINPDKPVSWKRINN